MAEFETVLFDVTNRVATITLNRPARKNAMNQQLKDELRTCWQRVKADAEIPIVFITGHGDIPMSVRAMKAGAVEFLTKPFGNEQFLYAVALAIERDAVERERRSEMEVLRERYELLTSRERQVMALVVEGMLNKQIAGRLGLSEITVKVYRAGVTRKMRAGSLVELVRIAQRLGMAVARH